MRLRLSIGLAILWSVLLPVAAQAAASASAVLAPAAQTFPDVVLPVYDSGPHISVTFVNVGSASVRMSTPALNGPNPALFHVEGSAGVIQLGPGETYTAVVEFLPYVPGTYRADLVVVTSEPGNPPITVRLTGTARATTVLEETIAGSRFVPLSPRRVLDTRTGVGWADGAITAGGTAVVQLPDAVDAAASAVVLNVTATDAAGPGFVTVWPAGKAQPLASSLNLERAGQTIANLVTVGLGPSRSVALASSGGTHLVADLAGYYLPTAATAPGRFQPVTPARLLDTRLAGGPLAGGETRRLAVAGNGGVPASGASAVMLNVTATGTGGAGFVTVWPADVGRPTVSNLNPTGAGQTVPNQAVVRLPANGALDLFSLAPTDLIVDVVGWFTDASAPVAVSGLFFPVGPIRLVDTRTGGGAAPAAGGVVPVDAVTAGVSGDALAAVTNVTATEAAGPGFVTAWSGQGAPPLASNLNVERAGQTVPNHVVAPLAAGRFALYTQSGTQLVVDLTGFFRGISQTAFAGP